MKQLPCGYHTRVTDTEAVRLSREECRRNYFELLNRQLCRLFPKFVSNSQVQTSPEREMGRAAVLEYSKGICSRQKVVKRQRLFLPEDLSRNHIEVLGSQASLALTGTSLLHLSSTIDLRFADSQRAGFS
ncbi:hypothetical protein V2W45_1366204 [Cenococcum geophilum]